MEACSLSCINIGVVTATGKLMIAHICASITASLSCARERQLRSNSVPLGESHVLQLWRRCVVVKGSCTEGLFWHRSLHLVCTPFQQTAFYSWFCNQISARLRLAQGKKWRVAGAVCAHGLSASLCATHRFQFVSRVASLANNHASPFHLRSRKRRIALLLIMESHT